MNRTRKVAVIVLAASILCVAAGWLLYGFFGHELIKAMYDGRSIAVLNNMLEGRTVHPVELYYRDADRLFLLLNVHFAIAVFVVLMLLRYRTDRIRKLLRLVFLTLVYMIVAAVVLNTFMTKWGFLGDSPRNGFRAMMERTAHRPFVYRVLMPTVVNTAASLVPDVVLVTEKDFLLENSPLLKYARVTEGLDEEVSLKYHITYLLIYGSLVLLLFSIRYLTGLLYLSASLVRDIAPAVALLLLPLTFLLGGYMYDFPELLFVTLCLIGLVKRQWLWYYLLFTLAVLNKESNVLIVLFFLAFEYKYLTNRRLAGHLAIHAILGGALLLAVRYHFASNPGAPVLFHLVDNLNFWFSVKTYFSYFDIYSPWLPFPRSANLILLFAVGSLLFCRWREKHLEVRRMLVFTSAVLIPLILCCSNTDEIRNLSIAFPAFYLLAFHTICSVYDEKIGLRTVRRSASDL